MSSTYKFQTSHLLPWSAIRERIEVLKNAGKGSETGTYPAPFSSVLSPIKAPFSVRSLSLCLIVSCGSYNPITRAHLQMLKLGYKFCNGDNEGVQFSSFVVDDDNISKIDLKKLSQGNKGENNDDDNGGGEVGGKDVLKKSGAFDKVSKFPRICIGAFISPVHDLYKKKDLAPGSQRIEASKIALQEEGERDREKRVRRARVSQTGENGGNKNNVCIAGDEEGTGVISEWAAVDEWEVQVSKDIAALRQTQQQQQATSSTDKKGGGIGGEGDQPLTEPPRTYNVLCHIAENVRAHYIETASTEEEKEIARGQIRLFFLCGGDLFETFYHSGVWEINLLRRIFKEFDVIVVSRFGCHNPIEIITENKNALLNRPSSPSIIESVVNIHEYVDKIHVLRMMKMNIEDKEDVSGEGKRHADSKLGNYTSSTRVREALRTILSSPPDADKEKINAAKTDLNLMLTPKVQEYLIKNKVYS